MLEFAILGLLHESPMHGYELRKRLNALLGAFRAFSYGSLYPTLRRMRNAGWISEDAQSKPAGSTAPALTPRRGRVVYQLTAEGKERFGELLAEVGPATSDDEQFGVHFAFFAKTSAEVRLRILEGRRIRVEEKQEGLRSTLARTRERMDRYTLELQQHGLDAVEREVRWLDELIAHERAHPGPTAEPHQHRRPDVADPTGPDDAPDRPGTPVTPATPDGSRLPNDPTTRRAGGPPDEPPTEPPTHEQV
ncbi:MAG TPA: PadR family transcriptional regulator [Mycobacteriales bacterium]|nr:PadR family transcriptional regulator [Mycobacteriales bacterium]